MNNKFSKIGFDMNNTGAFINDILQLWEGVVKSKTVCDLGGGTVGHIKKIMAMNFKVSKNSML